MNTLKTIVQTAALVLPVVWLVAAHAETDPGTTATADTPTKDWQERRLMHPTEAELAREATGEVVIYDHMTDKMVEAAIAQHFDRIPAMMFIGTIITDEAGEAEVDAYGMYAYDDGGC